jgi:hypothetical protein
MGSRSRRARPGLLPGGRYPLEPERLYVPEPGKPPPLGRSTYSPSPPYGNASELKQNPTVFAWCPPGTDPELTAVLLPKGEVTESRWWAALSDRVTALVMQQERPLRSALWAARALGTTYPEEARRAGEDLVQHNLELRTALTLDVMRDEDPFPAKVLVDSAELRQLLEDVDLEAWVNLARDRLSPGSLGC